MLLMSDSVLSGHFILISSRWYVVGSLFCGFLGYSLPEDRAGSTSSVGHCHVLCSNQIWIQVQPFGMDDISFKRHRFPLDII